MNSSFRILTAVACLLGIAFATAGADDFLVNDDGGSTEQTTPRIAVSGDHSFAIVWADKRLGSTDIFMQRYDSDAQPIGNNVRVNDNASNAFQYQPALAVDISGYYSVVWNDFRNGLYPFDPDIFYQRFDPSGLALGENLELTTEWPDTTKEEPDVSLSTWGTGVVVWADRRNANWDIYAQVFASDGSLIGTNFRVNDDAGPAQQHAPRVSTSADGWFVVAWYDNRFGHDDIFVQRFDSLGNALGVNTKVNNDMTTSRQAFPDVATDGAGHFTVVWTDWRNGIYPANPDIYACKLDTTMTAVTGNFKINIDTGDRAQRDVAIGADRMGNVCIVFADSSSSSWDIVGQMIDVDGVVRETNFTANSVTDSAQLRPDVALDGNYRYITWADRRSGNFDVYASVKKYNDPSLVVTPHQVVFEMPVGGNLPAPQPVVVEHIGYNRMAFEVSSYNTWIDFNPAVSSTPDTVWVEVGDSTLPHGSYFGAITITDTLFHDSTVVVGVRLDVTSPILDVSADTLAFGAPQGVNYAQFASFTISNIENGEFSWTATSSASWATAAPATGVSPAEVTVAVNPQALSVGTHTAAIAINAPGVAGAPDTVWVVVDVSDNLPFLSVIPDSLYLSASNYEPLDSFFVVQNLGGGGLSWSASTDADWLQLNPSGSAAGDQVQLSLGVESLPTGLYATYVSVTDSAAVNVSYDLPIVLDYAYIAEDTVSLLSVTVDPAASFAVPVDLRLLNAAAEIRLPLAFNPSMLHADSVTFATNIPLFMDKQYQISQTNGTVTLTTSRLIPDSFMTAGYYNFASVYFTANNDIYMTQLDTTWSPGNYARIVAHNGTEYTPVIYPSTIRVGDPASLVDTVRLDPLTVGPQSVGVVPVYLSCHRPVSELQLPLRYDPAMIAVDSVVYRDPLPAFMQSQYQLDHASGRLNLSIVSSVADSTLSLGSYWLANLFVTSGETEGQTTIDTVNEAGTYPVVIDRYGGEWTPEFFFSVVDIDSPTDVPGEPIDIPTEFALEQNYPNPFNGTTVIEYSIPRTGHASLSVYNILGQRVARPLHEPVSAGRYRESWDGRFDDGREAPSGIYFYRLQVGERTEVRKMVLLK